MKKYLDEILAVKGVTVADLKDSVLTPQQASEFILNLQGQDALLAPEGMIVAEAPQVNIDRVSILGNFVKAGSSHTGTTAKLEDGVNKANADFATEKLFMTELRGAIAFDNKAMRHNIAREGFADQLVTLISDAAYYDMASLLTWSNTADTTLSALYRLQDGWFAKAVNKVEGKTVAADGGIGILDAMKAKFPTRHYKHLLNGKGVYYVNRILLDAYKADLVNRQTGAGDKALIDGGDLAFDGIKVVYSAVLDEANGAAGILVPISNLKWGVFHEVTIDTDKDYDSGKTNFYAEFEAGAGFEDRNAVVTFVEVV